MFPSTSAALNGSSTSVALHELFCEDQDDCVEINSSNEISTSAFQVLDQLRNSGQLCDVSIVAGGTRFRAHRIVLAATIPYFNVMLTTDMREANSESIELPNTDPEGMEIVLHFVYTGTVKLTAKNIEKVLKIADYFQLHLLSKHCIDFLRNRISMHNALKMKQIAALHNEEKIIMEVNFFIQKNFVDISNTQQFLTLNIDVLLEILSWDELNTESEEQVFDAAMRWLKFDVTRKEFSSSVLSNIRFSLFQPEFLANELASNSIIQDCFKCKDLVNGARNLYAFSEKVLNVTGGNAKPRFCDGLPGIIYVFGGLNPSNQNSTSSVEMFDPLIGHWVPTKSMSSQRTRVCVTVLNRNIYVIGGYDGFERLRTCEFFSPYNSSWTRLAPMLHGRSAASAATLGDSIYVCGGYDGISALSSVESLDPELGGQWMNKPNMLQTRCAAAAVSINGVLYVIGGHNGAQIFSSVEKYNPFTGSWEYVVSMTTPRCRHSATVYRGNIFVCGGYDGSQFLNTAEIYDPVKNSWTPQPSMNIRRSRVSIVTNGRFLYAIGGYDGESNLASVEVFDPKESTWKFGANLISHEGGIGAAAVFNMKNS